MHFCGCNTEAFSGRVLKWQKNHLTWGLGFDELAGLNKQDLIAAYTEGIEAWSEVCAITFEYRERGGVDLWFEKGHIDGPSKTLAYQEMPPGDDRPLKGKYDAVERFVNAKNPAPGTIDAVRVVRHEVGHAIGIPHVPGSGALMSAMYSPTLRDLTERDIYEAQLRYGKPKSKPAPRPVDPTPSGKGFQGRVIHQYKDGILVDVSVDK